MLSLASLQFGLVIVSLINGIREDLRSRKVSNVSVLITLVLGLFCVLFVQGLSGLMIAALSFVTAFVAVLPLYLVKAIGGGDVKLFLAVSVLLNWQQVLISLIGSLIWGSILGVVQVILKGEGKAFAHNMIAIFTSKARLPEQKTHKVPYTIALLLGVLTSFVWTGIL